MLHNSAGFRVIVQLPVVGRRENADVQQERESDHALLSALQSQGKSVRWVASSG
jgi:hypothetical protein